MNYLHHNRKSLISEFEEIFRSLRSSFVMQHNKRKQRKFLWYSAYAWGVPLAWTIFTIYAEKFRPFENQWNPSIAVNTCFFNSMFLLCNDILADIFKMQCE